MVEYSWNRHAGGWVREDRGNRPVGPWRSRRLDRQVGRVVPGARPGDGPSGPGGPLASGDREPRRPIGPLPSLAAEAELPVPR